jgi:hypothetical protein
MRWRCSAILICVLSIVCEAKDDARPKTAAEAMDRASKLSQITLPGSVPFHLKATVAELASPDSDYKAEIEEYWVAPNKWKRTVRSPEFSETMVVNGEKIFEQNQGDYFPFWLRDFLTAIFNLAPDEIRQLQTPLPDMAGFQARKASSLPPGLKGLRRDTGTICVRGQRTVGIAPVQNNIFASVCFENPPGLLKSVVSPLFDAEFKDFKNFKGKNVARRISITPEPGTTIEARVTELEELQDPDAAMFDVAVPTAMQDRIASMRVTEELARGLLETSPEIKWMAVRDGKTTGTLSMLVEIDREGHVRETWPLNSDNPYLEDQARTAVALWKFKPYSAHGMPVQLETILTFAFATTIGDPIPVLSDTEARKLAITVAEPEFDRAKKPPSGTEFAVRAAVDEEGNVIGLKNINKLDMALLGPANVALHKWKFRPYLHGGKPDRFDADITFHVP